MTQQPRQLVITSTEAEPDPYAVVAAVGARFQVRRGPTRAVRRTWLDTFDWRLHDAGWSLEQTVAGALRTLTLVSPDGDRRSVAVPAIEWPAMVDAVPDEILRARLAPVADIRALLPVAEARSQVGEVALLDAEDKTVARVEVEVQDGNDPDVIARLTVRPLRGYDPAADRAVRLLLAADGVAIADSTPYDVALAAARRTPADRKELARPKLTADLPAARAMGMVLAGFFAELRVNLPGVKDDIDSEFLHDLRVAVRRTRSTLKLARPVLRPDVVDLFAAEFKWLGDLTTPTRDLDVHLLDFPTLTGWLSAAEPESLDPFRAHLARRREIELRQLVRGLGSGRFVRLLEEWPAALAEVIEDGDSSGDSSSDSSGDSSSDSSSAAHPAVGELAATSIAKTYRRVVKLGSAINADSPAEDLHTLRKRCKELRYALEIFATLHDPATQKAAISDLKGLQDCLGRFQDTEVQREVITVFAEQMMAAGTAPAATVLAMGELTVHLEVDQRRARSEFAEQFARFTRPGNQRRMQVMGAVAQ